MEHVICTILATATTALRDFAALWGPSQEGLEAPPGVAASTAWWADKPAWLVRGFDANAGVLTAGVTSLVWGDPDQRCASRVDHIYPSLMQDPRTGVSSHLLIHWYEGQWEDRIDGWVVITNPAVNREGVPNFDHPQPPLWLVEGSPYGDVPFTIGVEAPAAGWCAGPYHGVREVREGIKALTNFECEVEAARRLVAHEAHEAAARQEAAEKERKLATRWE